MSKVTDILNHNSFKDKRVFILAGGPSLKGFDFTPLANEITIGINKSFASFAVTYNMSLDRDFLNIIYRDKELLKKWDEYSGIKIFAIRKKSEKFSKDIHTVYVRRIRKHRTGYISLDVKDEIYPGNNSGFVAMMFAISCGCKEIYLLGLDCKLGPNNETHHHSGYAHTNLLRFEDKMEYFIKDFTTMAPKIKKLGVRVINLNSDSAVKCFEFDVLENILQK